MAVTRLERKARRNKSRAKVRVANLRRFQTRVYVESPNKAESGIILDAEDPFATLTETKAKAPKAKKAEAVAEEAPVTEEVAAEATEEVVAEAKEEAKA